MTDADDRERLRGLLEPIHQRARLSARRLCRSDAEGDDLFQDAAIRALTRLSELRDDGAFAAWFYRYPAVAAPQPRAAQRLAAMAFHGRCRRVRRGAGRRRRGARWEDERLGAERMRQALATLPAVQREARGAPPTWTTIARGDCAHAGRLSLRREVPRGPRRERLKKHYRRHAPSQRRSGRGRPSQAWPAGAIHHDPDLERSDIEMRIQADTTALRAASLPGLPSLASTLARLEDTRPTAARQRTSREGDIMTPQNTRKRWLPVLTTLAILTVAGGVFAATTTGLLSVLGRHRGQDRRGGRVGDPRSARQRRRAAAVGGRPAQRRPDQRGHRGREERQAAPHRPAAPRWRRRDHHRAARPRHDPRAGHDRRRAGRQDPGPDGRAPAWTATSSSRTGSSCVRHRKRVEDCGGDPCPE